MNRSRTLNSGVGALHKCRNRQQGAEKQGKFHEFFQEFCGVLSEIVRKHGLQTRRGSGILLQRGIAILDCEAAALPGRFLPELGRSSERPFFLAGLSALGFAWEPSEVSYDGKVLVTSNDQPQIAALAGESVRTATN